MTEEQKECFQCQEKQAVIDAQDAALKSAARWVGLLAPLSDAVVAAKKQPFSKRAKAMVKRRTQELLANLARGEDPLGDDGNGGSRLELVT